MLSPNKIAANTIPYTGSKLLMSVVVNASVTLTFLEINYRGITVHPNAKINNKIKSFDWENENYLAATAYKMEAIYRKE